MAGTLGCGRCFTAAADGKAEKFFNFDGGPFPNGPLHMGHVRTFTLGDAMARYQRMERGLIDRRPAPLNWCAKCRTTLAHMQVEDGRCWRCETPVEERLLTQWFVNISKYSALLSKGLERVEGFGSRVRMSCKASWARHRVSRSISPSRIEPR